MSSLQTKVNIPAPDFSIEYFDKMLLLGSCFSGNIGGKLKKMKFQALSNPFGVLYNPASISQALDILLQKKEFLLKELNHNNELWFSYYHHTSFSNFDKKKCITNINSSFLEAKEHIRQTKYIFLTLGTSWIFRRKDSGKLVANCHKIPASNFTRECLSPENIIEILNRSFKLIEEQNQDVKFILTVSPIRHWKDGAIENMRSKSALLLAIKELEIMFPNLFYFPVYEIFMDELRDYRFYSSDMLHPSDFAIEYVWDYFVKTFFSKDTQSTMFDIEKVVKSFEHRPQNTQGESFRKFVKSLTSKAEQLTTKHSFIDFSKELAKLNTYFV